jgi:hypothetical protein
MISIIAQTGGNEGETLKNLWIETKHLQGYWLTGWSDNVGDIAR